MAGETYGPVIGAITLLLHACAEDGSIRAGHDPDDVLLILGFLWRIDPGPGAKAKAARLLDLVVAGLQAGAPVERNIKPQRLPRPSGLGERAAAQLCLGKRAACRCCRSSGPRRRSGHQRARVLDRLLHIGRARAVDLSHDS